MLIVVEFQVVSSWRNSGKWYVCICSRLHHLVENFFKKREGKDVPEHLPRHPNGPQAPVSRGCGSQTWFSYQRRSRFEPEGVEREEQKVEYMPVQSMEVEVGGVDGWMTLASAEGRGELRKRKKDIGGDAPVLRCIERASFAHVVIRPSACSHVHPAFACLHIAA